VARWQVQKATSTSLPCRTRTEGTQEEAAEKRDSCSEVPNYPAQSLKCAKRVVAAWHHLYLFAMAYLVQVTRSADSTEVDHTRGRDDPGTYLWEGTGKQRGGNRKSAPPCWFSPGCSSYFPHRTGPGHERVTSTVRAGNLWMDCSNNSHAKISSKVISGAGQSPRTTTHHTRQAPGHAGNPGQVAFLPRSLFSPRNRGSIKKSN
jgi:hypothetical protein